METDFERMLQLIEMMNAFTGESAPPQPHAPPEASAPPNAGEAPMFYDRSAPSPELQMMKTILPYLEFPQQRTMGIMLKALEIKRLMEMYGAQIPGDDGWQSRLLGSIRPHIPQDRRYMIDVLVKLMEIKQILDREGTRWTSMQS